jgi:Domain of unknown function (DUF6378)
VTDIKDILKQRGGTHGPWELQARISENLWRIMLSTDKAYSPGQAQALHMICTKLGRIAAGDENEIDHWRDLAGYATLVANDLEPTLAEGFSMERADRAAEAQTRAAKLPPTVDPGPRSKYRETFENRD